MELIIVRKSPSRSASLLAKALGVRKFRPDAYPRRKYAIINWGCTSIPHIEGLIANDTDAVKLAVNKLQCCLTLEEHSVPTVNYFTGAYSEVRAKFPGEIIVARHTLTGNSGAGIQILRPGDPPPEHEAMAYTPYIKKHTEFRVHVAFGRVIHVIEKRKRAGAEPTADEKLVRNVGNTWVFCENDLSCDERNDRTQLSAVAINAVKALGLHFGAVDLLYSKQGEYVVCEVNTKPGIASTATLKAYTTAFKEAVCTRF